MKKNKVLVVGSSNTDFVIHCGRLPGPGETVMGGSALPSGGGKGANQAVAAARAGAQVIFAGALGDDDWGRLAKKNLVAEEIDVRFLAVKKTPGKNGGRVSSGTAFIFIGGKSKQNMIVVSPGANDLLTPEDVDAVWKDVNIARDLKVVIVQLEVPLKTVERAAENAELYGIPLILNPAPAKKLSIELLKRVAILTPNETEAEILTGSSKPLESAKRLLRMGVKAVAMTLGPKGVLLFDQNGARTFSPPKVKPIDTVGAGDCFTGWLGAGMAQGLSFDEAAKRAVVAASVSVTRPGAQSAMPYPKDLKKYLG